MALNVYLTITVIDASRASSEVFVLGKLIVMFMPAIKAIIPKASVNLHCVTQRRQDMSYAGLIGTHQGSGLPSTAVTVERTSRKSMYLVEDGLHEVLS